jgi:hypothetical protein
MIVSSMTYDRLKTVLYQYVHNLESTVIHTLDRTVFALYTAESWLFACLRHLIERRGKKKVRIIQHHVIVLVLHVAS